MRRLTEFLDNYQAARQLRLKRLAARQINSRRHLLALRRRRALLDAASPLRHSRLVRCERSRLERRRFRRGEMTFGFNFAFGGQQGSSKLMMIMAVLMIVMMVMFLLALPLMLMLGALNLFASKLFDLPGVKTLVQALTAIACADATKWIVDKLGGGGILGNFTGWLSDGASAFANSVQGVLGDNIATDYLTWPLKAVIGMDSLFKEVTQAAKDFQLMMCAIFDEKNGLLGTFKQQGLEKPFEAALSCSNWDPATMGPLSDTNKFTISSIPGQGEIKESNTKDGKPQFCLDGKNKNEAQDLVPGWLIPIYQAAAAKHNLPWELLAAINWNDTSYGAKELNKDQKNDQLKVNPKYSQQMTELNKLISAPDKEISANPVVKQLMKGVKPDQIRDKAQAAVDSAKTVSAEWQQQNPLKKDRAGWIPLSSTEWGETANDEGGVTFDWESSPYPRTLPGSAQACPGPVDIDGNLASGLPSGDSNGQSPKRAELSDIGQWPGDKAGKRAVAGWMAEAARKVGLPGQLPVMAALPESGLTNMKGGDRDSVGYFQMRTGLHNKGRYKGYPNQPKLQLLWFLDNALDWKAKKGGKIPSDPKGMGNFIADIERPAAQYRYKYAASYNEAKKLIGEASATVSNATVDVSFLPDGDTDTCDPVDSIFAIASWLSKRGARGEIWRSALTAQIGNLDKSEAQTGGAGPTFVEGDSLIDAARGPLKNEFRKNLRKIDAKDGRQVPEGIERIKRRGQNLPDVLVFALGANDPAASKATFRGWIDRVIKVADGRCVVWPTVYAAGPRFVSTLNKAAKKYDNLQVVAWHKIAADYVLESDPERIHVSSDGSRAYASLLRQGADKCSGSSTPPKKGKITGKKGEIFVSKAGSKLTFFSGATNYASIYRNKLGQIPRKGAAIFQDPNDNNLAYCEGGAGKIDKQQQRKLATNRYPGVAIKVTSLDDSRRTACGYWEITAPNGKRMIVMQSDVGPGAPGVHLDVNSTLAQELGYKPGNASFPSFQGLWSATYLGKKRPSNVNKLLAGGDVAAALQKVIKLKTDPPKEFRPKSVPPLSELDKENSNLPYRRSWVRDPAPPLNDRFPSFRSGLQADRDCGDPVISRQQMGVFFSAAKAFDLPWQVLVAYAGATSRYGCQPGIYSYYKGSYATDAEGDGRFNSSDAVDAVFSTARGLHALGGKDKLAEAARKMTPDKELLSEVADISAQLGYDAADFVELMDSAISKAVQERDHLIDKKVCEGIDKYVECIAELYRRIRGESGQAGKYITGRCGADTTVPDVSVRPITDNRVKPDKTKKGLYVANGTYGRADAIAASQAVYKTFQECHKEYKKDWQKVNVNDWGAAVYKASWAVGGHASHKNGGDNDTSTAGVSSGFNGIGTGTYKRSWSVELASMFLRAGAVEIFFDDVKVQKEIAKLRAKDKKRFKKAYQKLKSLNAWIDCPVLWAYGGTCADASGAGANSAHSNHYHIRWYPNGINEKPKIKVWLTNRPTADPKPAGSGPYDNSRGGR